MRALTQEEFESWLIYMYREGYTAGHNDEYLEYEVLVEKILKELEEVEK